MASGHQRIVKHHVRALQQLCGPRVSRPGSPGPAPTVQASPRRRSLLFRRVACAMSRFGDRGPAVE